MKKPIGKIKIFLGGYINYSNAQNLNCLALAKHLDKEKFEVYTLEIFSGDITIDLIKGVKLFNVFWPHRLSKYLAYLWGIINSDVVYLPKREIVGWNRFWLGIFKKNSFSTAEIILNEKAIAKAVKLFGNVEEVRCSYQCWNKLYSITKFMRKYNSLELGIKSEEKILYLGVELHSFLNMEKKVDRLENVVFIGNDLLRKGLDDVITLAEEFKMLTFHIIGSGNGLVDMQVIITEQKIKNVSYYGGLPHSKMIPIIKNMDLHLFPSRSEGFPKVTLEAAAAGVPSLVYSDYGASEWITDHKDGFVVDTFDEMKETIEELLNNPKLLQLTAKNAIEMAKRFDWKVRVKDWEDVIVKLVINS